MRGAIYISTDDHIPLRLGQEFAQLVLGHHRWPCPSRNLPTVLYSSTRRYFRLISWTTCDLNPVSGCYRRGPPLRRHRNLLEIYRCCRRGTSRMSLCFLQRFFGWIQAGQRWDPDCLPRIWCSRPPPVLEAEAAWICTLQHLAIHLCAS